VCAHASDSSYLSPRFLNLSCFCSSVSVSAGVAPFLLLSAVWVSLVSEPDLRKIEKEGLVPRLGSALHEADSVFSLSTQLLALAYIDENGMLKLPIPMSLACKTRYSELSRDLYGLHRAPDIDKRQLVS